MSLSLLQGYSSAEEENEDENSSSLSDEVEEDLAPKKRVKEQSSFFDPPKPTGVSLLPSAFDAFSEIAGPPEFLNNSVPVHVSNGGSDRRGRHGGRKPRKEKKELPAGVVVEAKAQLVGIRERVRSDAETSHVPTSAVPPPSSEGKRMLSATIPGAEDAAELLRMCMQCGVPKTYSNARGMVCPICGDRPPADPIKELEKKKGSMIKDKEKSKRMRGQSSHATWKSETEMQLRQQFD